jgi:hypothetical protein
VRLRSAGGQREAMFAKKEVDFLSAVSWRNKDSNIIVTRRNRKLASLKESILHRYGRVSAFRSLVLRDQVALTA